MCSLPFGGDRHTNAVGHALTQRAGCGFNARSYPILRMSGAFAVQLAEMLDVIDGNGRFAQRLIFRINGLYASKMQQGVKQHGGVSVGKDKAVAIGPDGIFRVVAEKALPEEV